jgi:hypothetical protein
MDHFFECNARFLACIAMVVRAWMLQTLDVDALCSAIQHEKLLPPRYWLLLLSTL